MSVGGGGAVRAPIARDVAAIAGSPGATRRSILKLTPATLGRTLRAHHLGAAVHRRGGFRGRIRFREQSVAARVPGDRRSPRDRIARGMRVTLMGSGRDHSTHIYYVIILIA